MMQPFSVRTEMTPPPASARPAVMTSVSALLLVVGSDVGQFSFMLKLPGHVPRNGVVLSAASTAPASDAPPACRSAAEQPLEQRTAVVEEPESSPLVAPESLAPVTPETPSATLPPASLPWGLLPPPPLLLQARAIVVMAHRALRWIDCMVEGSWP